MNELTTPSQSAPLAIDDKQLEALGLSLADGPDIANLAQSLDIHSRDQLSRFGIYSRIRIRGDPTHGAISCN